MNDLEKLHIESEYSEDTRDAEDLLVLRAAKAESKPSEHIPLAEVTKEFGL